MTKEKTTTSSSRALSWPARNPVWFVLMLLAVAGLAFAACGNDDDNDNGNTTPPTATPTTAANDPTPTPNNGNNDTPEPQPSDLDDIPRTTSASVSLTGAGATFPNVLYSTWVTEYNDMNRGIRVNYQSIGSGGGIRAVIDKTVDFGGTDGPMTDEQKGDAGSTVWHIPMAMGAVVPAKNPSGLPDDLRFSQTTIADIFLGKITKWNDPAIVADNPGAALPDRDIAVCHRSDGSGTTFIWVDFLAAISDEWRENIGVATSVNWPRGNFVGANGNEGVANCVRQITGAIGYVELAYATQNNLSVARLENAEGNFVEPSLQAVSQSAAGLIAAGTFPTDMEARVVNAPGADSWPAAGFTWLLVYQELDVLDGVTLEQAQELIRFMLWALDEDGGQKWAEPLDYAPIHPDVIALAHEAIKQLTFNGQPVWETMLP
jgi:phosphate transport system substrate-binding protein